MLRFKNRTVEKRDKNQIRVRGEKKMAVGKERGLLLYCERTRPELSPAPGSIQTRQSK